MRLKYPDANPRKTIRPIVQNWELNKSGLYSFKVVQASDNGSVNVTAQHPDFDEFILPINPSNLQISIPFAITTTATTGGILEEHNGSVFRSISISGTFGVAPGNLRSVMPAGKLDTGTDKIKQFTQGALVNTVGAAETVRSSIRSLAAISRLPGIVSGINQNTDALQELGFVKMNEFANYLISYAEFKKTPGGSKARLLFIDRKNGINYVVSPQTLDTTKDAGEAHIVRYRVMLKAWDLANGRVFVEGDADFLTDGPLALTRALSTLRAARAVLAAAAGLIRGVVADFDNVIQTVNEVGLLLKDSVGVAKSFADFDELVESKYYELRDASQALRKETASAFVANDATNPSGRPVVGSSTNRENQQRREHNNPLRTPQQRLALVGVLDGLSLNSISLSDADQALIDAKLGRVRNFTIADYDSMRSRFEDARNSFADALGLNDTTYDTVLGRTAAPKARDATSDDLKALKALNDLVEVVDSLTVSKDVTSERLVDPFLRAQTNANNPDLKIQSYTNGYPIPFPFNATLEQIAQQYLGDPNKIQEIIIANGLKAPYVDEDGFTRAFTSNGTGRQFTISDTTDLNVGQEIVLSSSSQLRSTRIILGIRKLAEASYLIEVDGSEDLANFKTAHAATLLSWLPGTINSSKLLTIPTNKPLGLELPKSRAIALTQNMDRQQKAMGVDVALTDNFDIAISNHGDAKYVAGVANGLQAVKIKLSLEKGSLKQHPEEGLGIQIGTRQIEHTADSIRSALENAILSDPRFSAITDLSVEFEGPVVRLNMRVKAADGSSVLPLSFTIR